VDLIKPPKAQRLPDIVTVEEAKRLIMTTFTLSSLTLTETDPPLLTKTDPLTSRVIAFC